MTDDSRKGIGGPKTTEGKKKVSQNARKHGLYASTAERLEAVEKTIGCSYEDTLDRMRVYYKPMDPLEDVLVRRIARCAWRMRVTESAENQVLGRRCDDGIVRIGTSYQNVIKTERFVDVHLHRAIRALRAKRSEEYEKSKNKLDSPRFMGNFPRE